VVLWGERPFSIDDAELRAFQAIDGTRTVRDLIEAMGSGTSRPARAAKVRLLAGRGAIDLLPTPLTENATVPQDRSVDSSARDLVTCI
jgi:hypothetical protein